MEIFLIRHGVAEPRGTREKDDDRELTPKGRKRMKRIVRTLDRLDVRFDRVVHSPLPRAAQTAELVMPLVDGKLTPDKRLAAPPTPSLLTALDGERVGVVGHEPYLTELCGMLTGTHAQAFVLDKGGVAWLSGDLKPGGMKLLALFPSRTLRRL
jgi:phosphohistidine phosphatase